MYVTLSGPRKRRLWVWLLRHRTPRHRRAYWLYRACAVFKRRIEAGVPMVGSDSVALRFAAKETIRRPRQRNKQPRAATTTAKRTTAWPRARGWPERMEQTHAPDAC